MTICCGGDAAGAAVVCCADFSHVIEAVHTVPRRAIPPVLHQLEYYFETYFCIIFSCRISAALGAASAVRLWRAFSLGGVGTVDLAASAVDCV